MQGQQLFGVGQLLRGDQLEVDMGKDRKEKGLQLVAVNFQRVVDVVGKLLEIHRLSAWRGVGDRCNPGCVVCLVVFFLAAWGSKPLLLGPFGLMGSVDQNQ